MWNGGGGDGGGGGSMQQKQQQQYQHMLTSVTYSTQNTYGQICNKTLHEILQNKIS
jgi:hypothetical protein